ncbi:glycosyltransferase family 4 protein [Virgibacillus sp. MSP4-1]|uniref:glycosyltransferase family 4 protein n=1 Tax=Virgibacillus sp. MSP4-1 TaxID=2700081 RepID=UPI0003A1F169|nr:glycosyltransferase family 4 protein [Virgibacillus sp. MSP4-1]QHS23475.1 glycosyltransferase family 4 protein [Virgibacillus sp. MSP4-1]
MKILFFTNSILASPSRYRIFQYEKYFRADNIKTFYSKFYSDKVFDFKMKHKEDYLSKKLLPLLFWLYAFLKRMMVLIFLAPFFDIIHINRDFISSINIPISKYLKVFNCKIVYEFDDALFLTHRPRKKTNYLISNADYVICGNEYLYEYAKKYNNNIVIIPTVVDKEQYINVEEHNETEHEDFIIGWIGAPTTIKNLKLVTDAINKITRVYPNVRFKIICDDHHGYLDKINNSYFVKWSLNTYLNDLKKIDIGIMPLIDDQFNKGKCGFKLIQYIALGKPILASPVGINKDIVYKSKAGYLCKTEKDWIDAIEKIMCDKSLRKQLSYNALYSFENEYNTNVQYEKIKRVLNNLVDSNNS